MRPNNQQVARAGEHFVAGELHRRGAYAVTFAGNMPRIDILASNRDQTKDVRIQVKTKSASSPGWQTQTTKGMPRSENPDESSYWVLVDLREPGVAPEYYVIPEWWIQNDIHGAHQAYLARHAGIRPRTQDSKHHKIDLKRIEPWRGRWDILGIFDNSPVEPTHVESTDSSEVLVTPGD